MGNGNTPKSVPNKNVAYVACILSNIFKNTIWCQRISISNKCKYHQQDLYSKRLKNLLFPDHKTKV
jgi:hypothetical protein